MGRVRLGVVVVAQNDAETIERSVRSYYDHVDAILVSTDPARGWSGAPITPDDTLDRIRRLDAGEKVIVRTGDYYRTIDPNRNDTLQRQDAADALAHHRPGLDWVLQVDADEVFLDFPWLRDRLAGRWPWTATLSWWRVTVFNTTLARRLLGLEYKPPFAPDRPAVPRAAALHFTFAKSRPRIVEKLSTWSHAHQVDGSAVLAAWDRSVTDWAAVRDFHPLNPARWPALRPFTVDELLAYDGPLGTPYRSR